MNGMFQRAPGVAGMLTFGPVLGVGGGDIHSTVIEISATTIPLGICACTPSQCLLTVAEMDAFVVPL